MGEATLAAVEGAGLTLEEIDLFVYHQANGRILRALAEKLQLPSERVVDCIENLGNSSAATLPLGLVDGRARRPAEARRARAAQRVRRRASPGAPA